MNIDELERLEKAATQGDWLSDGAHVYGPRDSRSQYKNGRQLVATATDLPFTRQMSETPRNPDAALIAAARNALPALLRVAKAAKAMLGPINAVQGMPLGTEEEIAAFVEAGLAESHAAEAELHAALESLGGEP